MRKRESEGLALRAYLLGFALSIVLTLAAYFAVISLKTNYWLILFIILALAVAQLFVQLYFFLHLAHEKKPRLRQISFWFAASVVLIIVFGSLWIMQNLNYRHGSHQPKDIDSYIQNEEAIKKDPSAHGH